MKRIKQFTGFYLVALFSALMACNEVETILPDTPVVAGDPDSVSYEYVAWFDTNMNNAIFGTGPSVFLFMNNPGIMDDTIEFTDADTTVTITRRYLSADTCRFLVFDSFPGNSKEIKGSYPVSGPDGSMKATLGGATFPTSKCRVDGVTVTNSPIEVIDNKVYVLGVSFSVDHPTAYGPPSLGASLAHSIKNYPSCPTPEEIALIPCGECIGGFPKSRQIYIHLDKHYKWKANGVNYIRQDYYTFSYSFYWYYKCPNGPLDLEMLCYVRARKKVWKNGFLSSNHSIEAIHYHKY